MATYKKGESTFLASLVKFLNRRFQVDKLDSWVIGKEDIVPWTEEFYNSATLESEGGPKDGALRINPQDFKALMGEIARGFSPANAVVGAFQVTSYFGYYEPKSTTVPNPFADNYFVRLMLNYYGNIKVFKNTGRSKKYSVATPSDVVGHDMSEASQKKNKEFMQKLRPKSTADPRSPIGYGGLWPDSAHQQKYDNWFKDRIHPALLGGLPLDFKPTFSITGFETIDSTDGFPYLPEIFMKHLGPKPDFSDQDERRLFLLMGGQKYGKHDIAYLNIMDADDSVVYSGIPQKVKDYWQAHYATAVQLESAATPSGGLAQVSELIGAEPNVQLFAKYITHGPPDDFVSKWKVKSIKEIHERNYAVRYPLFTTSMWTAAPGTKLWGSTLVIPKLETQDLCPGHIKGDGGVTTILADKGNDEDHRGGLLFRGFTGNTPGGSELQKSGQWELSYGQNWPSSKISTQGYTLKALGRKYVIPNSMLTQVQQAAPWAATNDNNKVGFNVEALSDPKTVYYKLSKEIFQKGNMNGHAYTYFHNFDFKAGPLFSVKKQNTLLDYSPDKYISEYTKNLMNTVGAKAGGAKINYITSTSNKEEDKALFEIPPEIVKKVYAPLRYAISTITSEFNKFEARIRHLDDLLGGSTDEEPVQIAIDSGLILDPVSFLQAGQSTDPNDRGDDIYLQLWIDAVNSASAKVTQWLYLAQAYTEIFTNYAAVVALNLQGKTPDEVLNLLKKGGASPNSPSGYSKAPFNIDPQAPPDTPTSQLTPEQIAEKLEDRRRNIDQCLLSTNIDKLREAYEGNIIDQLDLVSTNPGAFSIHKTSDGFALPFGGRFHMLGHSRGKYSEIPNLLASPPGSKIKPLLMITPEIQSALTPKIRLYKINTIRNKDIETEFVFENFVSNSEASGLSNGSAIQKGRGGGIKSFTFTYEGTTPATAKKDINAELVLYFQSFTELTKVRGSGQNKYKFIDLLLYPTNQKNENIHPDQYNPANFRIRADVGWNPRTDKSFKRILEERYKKLYREEQDRVVKATFKEMNDPNNSSR